MYLYNNIISSLEYSSPLLIPRRYVSSNTFRRKGNEYNFYKRFFAYKQISLISNIFNSFFILIFITNSLRVLIDSNIVLIVTRSIS
jgi:hypothetical protein